MMTIMIKISTCHINPTSKSVILFSLLYPFAVFTMTMMHKKCKHDAIIYRTNCCCVAISKKRA